jgi:cell division protein FtsB
MIYSKNFQYIIIRIVSFLKKEYLIYGVIFALALIFFIIFAGRGLVQIHHLKKEQEKVKIATGRLQAENKNIAEQIEKMKKNTKEEVEKIAREELGLVKKGEIIYKFE